MKDYAALPAMEMPLSVTDTSAIDFTAKRLGLTHDVAVKLLADFGKFIL